MRWPWRRSREAGVGEGAAADPSHDVTTGEELPLAMNELGLLAHELAHIIERRTGPRAGAGSVAPR